MKSKYEALFCNFLSLNKIKFEYESFISSKSKHKCDFKIDQYYIEIWGLNIDGYSKNRKIKEELYKKENLNLISINKNIFNGSFQNLINEFKNVLLQCGRVCDNFNQDNLNNYKIVRDDEIIKELKQFCKTNTIKLMPTIEEWKKYGFKVYIEYYIRNKVSIHDLALKLEIYPRRKKPFFYKDLENFLLTFKSVIDENDGVFPTQTFLLNNRVDILNAVNYHGGLIKIQKLLNMESSRKQQNYWNIETIKVELLSIINDIKKFPSEKYLRSINRTDLCKAISRNGGYKKLKEYF